MISSEQEAQDLVLETLHGVNLLYGLGAKTENCSAKYACSYFEELFAQEWSHFKSNLITAEDLHTSIGTAFDLVLDLVLELAPFACKQLPSELNVSELPIFWSVVNLFSLLCGFLWESGRGDLGVSSAVLLSHRICYQYKGVKLMKLYLMSKTMFAKHPGEVSGAMNYLRVSVASSMAFLLDDVKRAPLTEGQKNTLYETAASLLIRLRIASLMPSDPVSTAPPELFRITMPQLTKCFDFMLLYNESRSITASPPSISALANTSHAEVVQQHFRLIQNSSTFDIDTPSELFFLCFLVIYDQSPELLRALSVNDFLRCCVAQAHEFLPPFRAALHEAELPPTKNWFYGMVSGLSVAISKTLQVDDLGFAEAAVQSGLLFVLEVYLIIVLHASDADVKAKGIVEMLVHYLPRLSTTEIVIALFTQIHTIRARVRTNPSASDQLKQFWDQFELSAIVQDDIANLICPPTYVCGLIGCQSTDSAPLQCARCKAEYYCSIECQKPAWRVHKRHCKAPSP
ncbi:hypothetical protein DL93DRAFT_2091578 [Clavulina sp. PMI_390]|nr:hypothetical protein DL93DRAFT_2091578 [Clavulina sp. PMI_390]